MKRRMRIKLLLPLLLLAVGWSGGMMQAQVPVGSAYTFEFQPDNTVFQLNYRQNQTQLQQLNRAIALKHELLTTGRAYLCIVAGGSRGAMLASIIRANCMVTHHFLTNQFVVQTDPNDYSDNAVGVIVVESPLPEGAVSSVPTHHHTHPSPHPQITKPPNHQITPRRTPTELRHSILVDIEREIAHSKSTVDTTTGSTHEYDREVETISFTYQINSSDPSDFANDHDALNRLDAIFADQQKSARIVAISITASASPDGPTEYNETLAIERGRTLERFLRNRYPVVSTKEVFVRSAGENWAGLRVMVDNDPQVPFRNEVLTLLDRDVNPTTRERQLRALGNGAPFRYMTRYLFPKLRSAAAVSLFYQPHAHTPPVAAAAPTVSATEKIADSVADTIPAETFALLPDTVHITLPPAPVKPLLAVKTNLLMLALTAPNIEVEVPIGRRFSVAAEWIFPWWGLYTKQLYLQLMNGNIEARYWFGDHISNRPDRPVLTGPFVGIYTGYGTYDLMFEKDKGYQGTFTTFGGISAGYAHTITRNKNLRLEYSLGLSYTQHTYRKYIWDGYDYMLIAPGQQQWKDDLLFDPLKTLRAKVSLVWLFNIKQKKGGNQ